MNTGKTFCGVCPTPMTISAGKCQFNPDYNNKCIFTNEVGPSFPNCFGDNCLDESISYIHEGDKIFRPSQTSSRSVQPVSVETINVFTDCNDDAKFDSMHTLMDKTTVCGRGHFLKWEQDPDIYVKRNCNIGLR